MSTAELLLPLVDRFDSLHRPCRVHRSLPDIGADLHSWVARMGMAVTDEDGIRVRASGFDRLAARALSEERMRNRSGTHTFR